MKVLILCGGKGTRMMSELNSKMIKENCLHRRFGIVRAVCLDCGCNLADECVIEAIKEMARIEERSKK